jgi:hypothetical protein
LANCWNSNSIFAGIVILFSAGLHFTFSGLKHVGIQAVIIGIAGVIVPLVLGYGISILFGIDWMVAIIIGATLSANYWRNTKCNKYCSSCNNFGRIRKRENKRGKYFG